MKKLMFAVVFLFISTALVAQDNVATTTQTGDDQEAVTNQIGTNNNAVVTQNQSGTPSNSPAYMNSAMVHQEGELNQAVVNQDELGDGNKGMNDAVINQYGYNNLSVQTTIAPGFNADQNVEGFQEGEDNILTQTITSGYTDHFYAEQHGMRNEATQLGTNVTYNTAGILQIGEDNIAVQDLYGSNNGYYGGIYDGEQVHIHQDGLRNNALQTLTGNGFSHGNSAIARQFGEDNVSDQEGVGRNLWSEVHQEGVLNDAETKQFGEEQQAFVNQIGEQNKAVVWQGVSYGPKVGNFAEVNQGAFADWAFVNQQFGNNNTAFVNQFGAPGGPLRMSQNNYATVYQSNSDNLANVYQDGHVNGIFTSQQGTNGIMNTTQHGHLGFDPAEDQPGTWGYNNYADLDQLSGDGSEMNLFQEGIDNFAHSVQEGDMHWGLIEQHGTSHEGFINQTGSGNTATVFQTD